jgi:chromosome partitioning protein
VQVIGICGRKGGSGKTTAAVHLASELASRGHSVTLADCDPQGSAKHWSALGELPMPVIQFPVTRRQDIDALAGAVRGLESDYLVLDSPPHLDAALGAVIGLSDVAVIPCGPSGLDLVATAETISLVRDIRKATGGRRPVICLVPNRVDTRTSSGRQLSDALGDLGEDVSPAVHNRTSLADSFNLGAWVGAYAPQSPAHLEVIALTNHVLKLLGSKPGKR